MGTEHLSDEQRKILDTTSCLIGLLAKTREGSVWQCISDSRSLTAPDTVGMRLSWIPYPGKRDGQTVQFITTTRYGRYIDDISDRLNDIVEIVGETPARKVASQMCVAHARGLLDLTQWPEAREFITTFEPDVVFPPFQSSPCA